jgi:hypothetical protein
MPRAGALSNRQPVPVEPGHIPATAMGTSGHTKGQRICYAAVARGQGSRLQNFFWTGGSSWTEPVQDLCHVYCLLFKLTALPHSILTT